MANNILQNHLTVRLPNDLRRRVKRQAVLEDRSQNSVIIVALRAYLDDPDSDEERI